MYSSINVLNLLFLEWMQNFLKLARHFLKFPKTAYIHVLWTGTVLPELWWSCSIQCGFAHNYKYDTNFKCKAENIPSNFILRKINSFKFPESLKLLLYFKVSQKEHPDFLNFGQFWGKVEAVGLLPCGTATQMGGGLAHLQYQMATERAITPSTHQATSISHSTHYMYRDKIKMLLDKMNSH